MRRRRKFPFVIFTLWLCIGMVGFLLGYYFAPEGSGKEPSHIGEEQNPATDINEIKEAKGSTNADVDQEENQPVSSYEVIIGSDTKVVFRTMYTKCQNHGVEVKDPFVEMIGLKEREFKEYASAHLHEWHVIKFSGDEVILNQRKDQYCPEHFLVMDDGGYITIYQYNEEGKPVLIEKTQIPTTNLPKMDQDRLKDGIPLETRDAVNQLLEDFIG